MSQIHSPDGACALEMFGLTKAAVETEIRNRLHAKLFDGMDQAMLTAKVICMTYLSLII